MHKEELGLRNEKDYIHVPIVLFQYAEITIHHYV